MMDAVHFRALKEIAGKALLCSHPQKTAREVATKFEAFCNMAATSDPQQQKWHRNLNLKLIKYITRPMGNYYAFR